MRRHVILAAAMGAMLVAAAPAELASTDGLMADIIDEENEFTGPGFDNPTREQCLRGGWQDYPFRNQGQCIRLASESRRLYGS